MVVDTSALLAVLMTEQDAERYSVTMAAAPVLQISVVSVMEAHVVLEHRIPGSGEKLDRLIQQLPLDLCSVDLAQLRAAREAFSRFGKGRHAARLNFGDFFSYALAKTTGEPLLYKGADFALTDIDSALP